MRSMIIREWTDPENSMHPGLDYWREPQAATPPVWRSQRAQNPDGRQRPSRKGNLRQQNTANGEDRDYPLSASKQQKRPEGPSSGARGRLGGVRAGVLTQGRQHGEPPG